MRGGEIQKPTTWSFGLSQRFRPFHFFIFNQKERICYAINSHKRIFVTNFKIAPGDKIAQQLKTKRTNKRIKHLNIKVFHMICEHDTDNIIKYFHLFNQESYSFIYSFICIMESVKGCDFLCNFLLLNNIKKLITNLYWFTLSSVTETSFLIENIFLGYRILSQ